MASSKLNGIGRSTDSKEKKESRFQSFFHRTVSDIDLRKTSKDTKCEKKESKFLMMFRTSQNILPSEADSKGNLNTKETKQDKSKDLRYAMIFNKDMIPKHKSIKTNSNTVKNEEIKKVEKDSKHNIKFSKNKSMSRVNVFKSFEELRGPNSERSNKTHKSSGESVYKLQSSLFLNIPPAANNRDLRTTKSLISTRKSKLTNEYEKTQSSFPKISKSPLPEMNRTDLKTYNSMIHLSKVKGNRSMRPNGNVKSMSSLTTLDTPHGKFWKGNSCLRVTSWDPWEDLNSATDDPEKRLNLQVSKSSNDHSRLHNLKSKKDDAISVSDSELLTKDVDKKRSARKGDKKSRGDSQKKEKDCGSRKQVQWKTDVDVIYFASHLAGDGDRSGEVLGRAVEPLREEWEQERKGLYAKTVQFPLESPLKERWISLLKI